MNPNQAKSTPKSPCKIGAAAPRMAMAQAEAEHRAWLSKYLPVEQKILAERERMFERRSELRAERRARRAREFGDIQEAMSGLSIAVCGILTVVLASVFANIPMG